MIKGLLGKKVGMTKILDSQKSSAAFIPVTVISVPPAVVIQKKIIKNDGYESVKIGIDVVPKNKIAKLSKPYAGLFKNQAPTRYLKEFKADDIDKVELGQIFDISIFKEGDLVDVSATTKGKGFAGVMKRHQFAGGPASHGHRFHRTTGSIGNRKFPGRVFKNKKMPGHMGAARLTVQRLKIVKMELDKNLIAVSGAVPGAKGGIVEIRKTVKN